MERLRHCLERLSHWFLPTYKRALFWEFFIPHSQYQGSSTYYLEEEEERPKKMMNRAEADALLAATIQALHSWVRGELRRPAPTITEGIYALDHVSQIQMQCDVDCPPEVSLKFKDLFLQTHAGPDAPDISFYFASVANHRELVRAMQELWEISGPPTGNLTLRAELTDRVRRHDITKYGPHECLGYFLKWSLQRVLTTKEEDCWQRALNHHYCQNDHHPEFFTQGSFVMAGEEPLMDMPEAALIEACIDMLARRLELDLQHKRATGIHPTELFAIPTRFLNRFGVIKEEVALYLFDWGAKLADMVCSSRWWSTTRCSTQLQDWQKKWGVKLMSLEPSYELLTEEVRKEEKQWRKDWQDILHLAMPLVEEQTPPTDDPEENEGAAASRASTTTFEDASAEVEPVEESEDSLPEELLFNDCVL